MAVGTRHGQKFRLTTVIPIQEPRGPVRAVAWLEAAGGRTQGFTGSSPLRAMPKTRLEFVLRRAIFAPVLYRRNRGLSCAPCPVVSADA
jgi:hypothetical protein